MKRKRGRGAMIAVFVIAVIVFGGIWAAWSTFTDVFLPPANAPKQITLVIQDGESTQQIANDLEGKGLIRNALAFRVWVRLKGLDGALEAGAYILSPNMTIDQIITRLGKGQPDEKRLAVIDGYRLEQIANAAEAINLTHFSKKDFLNYTHNPKKFPDAAKYPILKNLITMEGLLFPDTYLIPVNYDTVKVIDMMLDEFTQVIQQYNLVNIAKQHQLNEYDMITLASIVQREAGTKDDMGVIAGIYWNR
ncbi:MAG TPA: endolytic transglycosylase MltG, partial [Ktedonobacteraceae bacterium]|nr:endolytic transglycosylase MltG [Ktedonobacteraceae bacterium]